MKYWVDTEFIEDGKTIDLISIGIVSEDGRELYLENSECNLHRASPWVRDNVIPHLTGDRWDRVAIATSVRNFVDPARYGYPEIWAYYADYDWVALCQLFGTMMDLPSGWPMFCRDLKQFADMYGNPRLPDQLSAEHNALNDARWTKQAWEFVSSLMNAPEKVA